ncbi:hypothetical protein [Nocardioides sp.]|uniref:hypothetical protein n=1 Tax=Nocardioides sp. TaxID=35761 RepID=UPI003562AF84
MIRPLVEPWTLVPVSEVPHALTGPVAGSGTRAEPTAHASRTAAGPTAGSKAEAALTVAISTIGGGVDGEPRATADDQPGHGDPGHRPNPIDPVTPGWLVGRVGNRWLLFGLRFDLGFGLGFDLGFGVLVVRTFHAQQGA